VEELVSDTERYTYIVYKSPFWGIGERDCVIHSEIMQDAGTLTVTFTGESVPDKMERNTKYVRITGGISIWKFVPLADDMVEVTFQGYANPGGIMEKFPCAFLMKKNLWKLPFESLKNLKDEVKKSKYQNVHFDFIKDAAANKR